MNLLKPLLSLLAVLASTWLVSCSSTPQSRIEKNPAIYGSLPSSQQDLVRQGKIEKGMTREAVELAWGKPDRIGSVDKSGQITERWTYTALQPIYTSSFGMGYVAPIYSHYHCGRRYYGHYEPYFAPQIDYVPVPAARVDFRSGKVVEWEVRRQ